MELNPNWKRSEMPPVPPPQTHAPALIARPYLIEWTGKIVACPHCTSARVYKRFTRKASDTTLTWKCHTCLKSFQVPRGTGDSSVSAASSVG